MAKPRSYKPRKRTHAEQVELDAEFRILFTDLMTAWSSCEANVRGIFAKLLLTDIWRADLILYSITSTRSRIEIINRLALLTIDKRRTKHLAKLCGEFKTVTTWRHRLAHSCYKFVSSTEGGDLGIVTEATFVNFQKPNYDDDSYYEQFEIDRNLFNQMRQMTLRAGSLSQRFLAFERSLDKSPPHRFDVVKPEERPVLRSIDRSPKARRRSQGGPLKH